MAQTRMKANQVQQIRAAQRIIRRLHEAIFLRSPSLTSGPIGVTLLKLTAPMLVGIFAMTAFNLTDTYFVSFLGTEALAAISFTFPAVFVLNTIAHGIAIGTAAVISQAIGAGDHQRMRWLTTDASVLGLVVAVPLTVIGLLTVNPLFAALGAGPEILPIISNYMIIWYFGLVFVVVPAVGMNAIRALGDAVTPAIIMMVAFGMNVVLDPLLIFGVGGLPRMGIAGAALATVISRGFTALAVLWLMWFKKRMLVPSVPNPRALLKSWSEVLHVGVPATGALLLTPLSQTGIIRIVSRFGPDAVGAVGAGMRLEGLALMLVMALSSALMPFTGQNWGAGKHQRVVVGVRQSIQFSITWGILCLIVLALFSGHLARLFSEDPRVIGRLQIFLSIVPLGYGLQGVVMLAGTTFNAVCRPRCSLALSVVHLFMLLLPFAYVGSIIFGFVGVLTGVALANVFAGLVALRWLKGIAAKQTAVAA